MVEAVPNLKFKLKSAPIFYDLQYKDLDKLFVVENDEKYDILIAQPSDTLNLNLPYITNLAYHDYHPIMILIHGKNHQKLVLRSTHIQSMYVSHGDGRGKVHLTIDYEFFSPKDEILEFFGIIMSDWIKLRLKFRNFKEKVIQQMQNLLDPGIQDTEHQIRCKECRSLKVKTKTSDAVLFEQEEVCPSCLAALSKRISRIKTQVDAFTADYGTFTKKHDSLIKQMDSAIQFSIKQRDDTSKLYLGYLKSKFMVNTLKYHTLGLQSMSQIFELISDYEYVRHLNLPPEFSEDVEQCLIDGYVKSKRHVEALKVAEIGYNLNRKAQNSFKMAKSLNRLSELYLSLNQYDDAEECAEQSYNLHVKNKFTGQSLERSAEILTRIYKIKGQDDKIRGIKLHRFF